MSLIDSFEKHLLHGGARWVADLREFFRDYDLEDVRFALYARGGTRNKGLFLSRFFASTVLPNYSVALFCSDERDSPLTLERLRKKIDTVSRATKKDDTHWTWLLVFSNREILPQVVSFVSTFERDGIGLGVASTSSGQTVFSNNTLGASIKRHLGLLRIMKRAGLS